MNNSELLEALGKMSPAQFENFVREFGGEFHKPEEVVRGFVDHPSWERRLCQLLGLSTEEEKLVRAAATSAWSAKWSAVLSVIATAIAVIALIARFSGALK